LHKQLNIYIMDLSKTIIPKSDQLNADDLVSGAMTIKIRDIKAGADEQQPVNLYFEGDNNKPYKPCKSMRRLLVQIWGADGTQYIGRSMTLFRDDSVKFGGVDVGGIRISHVSHIDEPVKVLITTAKSKRRPFEVQPLKAVTKKALSEDRFIKALKAVADGKVTVESIVSEFEITIEQLAQLNEIKPK
jgi:hypothetical protein